MFDRDGNYWSLVCPVGVCLSAGVAAQSGKELHPITAPLSRLDQPWQLSSLVGNVLFEDRDGNVWVGTQKGLERFRDNRLSQVKLQGQERGVALAKDALGTVWALGWPGNTLWKLMPNGDAKLQETMPASDIRIIASGADGALLIAQPGGIERRWHGQVTHIDYPQDAVPGAKLFVNRLLDDGVHLWVSLGHRGTYVRRDGQWQDIKILGLPSSLFFASPGVKGTMWLGFRDGLIAHYGQDGITRYPNTPVGTISFLAEDHGIVAGGDNGLAVLHGRDFRLLKTADPDALASVTGMVVQANGDRWLHARQGVVHIKAVDWAAALANPDASLQYTLYGVRDGFVGTGAGTGRSLTAMGDAAGQLWFANSGVLLHFDTTQLPRPQSAPVPKIEALSVQELSLHDLTNPLQLAPGTNAFRIEYTALSYTHPERLSFRYQLHGVDAGWQQAGNRRAISYNNLGPGDYRFRVAATDDRGQGSEAPAEIMIRILPTFQQTPWFYGLCALALAGLVYFLYLMRLKQAMQRLGERVKERERIARTLHDSFLQSVQGLVLSFSSLASELSAGSAGRNKMERVLALAERVMEEGRDEVQDLRTNAIPHGDPGRALGQIGEVLQDSHDSVFSMRQAVPTAPLADEAAKEVYRIGREALLNAFRHSGAKAIAVELEYGADQFILRVVDNGCGIESVILAQGRAGHWGLPGMAERAARLGGRLSIQSSPGCTRVELILPATSAYRRKPSWVQRLCTSLHI